MMRSRTRQILRSLLVPLIAFGGLIAFLQWRSQFAVVNRAQPTDEAASALTSTTTSPFTGKPCEGGKRRPFAVMLSADKEARPLSGIGAADIVVEMPVVTGLVNRLMALYQCEGPAEIGSVRSARHDFIPLAAAFDAIYAHWGGSHFALEQLKQGVIDNLDAFPNPADAFFRKRGIPQPHNGFTSVERLEKAARVLGYRLDRREGVGYPHISYYEPPPAPVPAGELTIEYPNNFDVTFRYDPSTVRYLRSRDSRAERDKLTGEQVAVENVVIMRAVSYQIEGDYNTVRLEGEGQAAFYISGFEIKGRWSKDRAQLESPLKFFDEQGREVLFQPGKIWISIVEPERQVTWKTIE
ncbi:DUF3048 domain-containing protein [Candidatus Parcubacteria bacterium]|nr:DUF3048 domain-containing protein [Candidatus Parcubacteria bacterium]